MKPVAPGAIAVAALLTLASCGSTSTDDDGNLPYDVSTTGDGGASVDIGDGTISTDKDGNGSYKGADGMEVKTDAAGHTLVKLPGGEWVDPYAKTEAKPLPLGLSLPAQSVVDKRTDRADAGGGSTSVVEAETMRPYDEIVAHFRAQARAHGLAITADTAGENQQTITAGGPNGSFTAVVKKMLVGATFTLTATGTR